MPAVVAPQPKVEETQLVKKETIQVKSESTSSTKKVGAVAYNPMTNSKNVEEFVNDYFADIPIMAKIAKCESRYRHFDSSGEVLRGEHNTSDRGVMQINLYYHNAAAVKLGLDLHNIEDNVAYARHLYEREGTRPWNSSSACWSKYIAQEVVSL